MISCISLWRARAAYRTDSTAPSRAALRTKQRRRWRSSTWSGLLKGEFDPAAFVERFRAVRENTETRMPDWLTADLVARVADRYRRLQGQWRATPFGETMELAFNA